MQETQKMHIPFLGGEDLLEEEMVIHSSILAWKTPWTEKPGRLQSMGSQRVGLSMQASRFEQPTHREEVIEHIP